MVKKKIERAIQSAVQMLSLDDSSTRLERPSDDTHGDYATSIALSCAKKSGKNPRELAGEIVSEIKKQNVPFIAKMEIAGPGFINFFLTDEAVEKNLTTTLNTLENGFDFKKGEKIHIEFISANPTGALHIGHGRGAFYGDVLANVFTYAGAEVTREYYINDSRESNQIKELGKTALGKGEQYKTEKITQLIKESNFSGMDEAEAGFSLAAKVQESNKNFITEKLNIRFDEWYSEDARLRATWANDATLARLKEYTYEKDGAVWLKTSEYGDDEDRVVVRSDGTKSYFISDIAYHDDKFKRGFDIAVDVWGADHHGHVKRMQAVKKMLGWKGNLKVFITQLVSLKEGDEIKKMSKRAGNVILLEDFVDEFGIDVVRWFFSEKTLHTHMEFDAALAKEQSDKNPVYYAQYAHARISSIKRNAEKITRDNTQIRDTFSTPSARALANVITEFPEIVLDIAETYHVHALPAYAYRLATAFSAFYHDVRILEDDVCHEGARALAESAGNILAKTLSLLGISAPERM